MTIEVTRCYNNVVFNFFFSFFCLFAFYKLIASNPEESLEKCLQLLNNGSLFYCPVAATEAGDIWHDFVDVRSRGFDLAVSERILQKLAGFRLFQLFLLDNLKELFFFFIRNICSL